MAICERSEETRIGVALTEALLNAYFHGNLEVPKNLRDESPSEYHDLARKRSQQPGFKERRITLNARFSRTDVVLSIRDGGKGFDISQHPLQVDASAMRKPHGRGLFLMRSFMDEVRFNQTGSGVTMTKRAAKPKT
jgi:anti-sigma regulatory factor (Ser/Thr protein kinase)